MEAQEQGTTVEVRGRFRPVRRRFLFSLGIFLLTGGVGLIGYAHEQQRAAFGDQIPLIVWLGIYGPELGTEEPEDSTDPADQYFDFEDSERADLLPSRRIYAAGIALASAGAFLVAFQLFPPMGPSKTGQ